VTPPGQAFVTITTTGGLAANGGTPPGLYTVSVTGDSGAASQTVTLTLNVVNVTESYTISVSPTTATPSPVPAGTIATTIVTVTPIANYVGQVTLACLSVTPVVQAAPYCSFVATSGSGSLPPNPPNTVQVTAGSPATATLTITTLGPIPVTELRHRRIFYALWLLVPGIVFVGAGAIGVRGKSLLGGLLLIAIAGGLLLMPACSSTRTNSPNGEITPNNTYTFTLTGVDKNGVAPANSTTCPTGQTCNLATVTLAVN
jgi:hypothetical protein